MLRRVLVKGQPTDEDGAYRDKRAPKGQMSSSYACEVACVTSQLPHRTSRQVQTIKHLAVQWFVARLSYSISIF